MIPKVYRYKGFEMLTIAPGHKCATQQMPDLCSTVRLKRICIRKIFKLTHVKLFAKILPRFLSQIIHLQSNFLNY